MSVSLVLPAPFSALRSGQKRALFSAVAALQPSAELSGQSDLLGAKASQNETFMTRKLLSEWHLMTMQLLRNG